MPVLKNLKKKNKLSFFRKYEELAFKKKIKKYYFLDLTDTFGIPVNNGLFGHSFHSLKKSPKNQTFRNKYCSRVLNRIIKLKIKVTLV